MKYLFKEVNLNKKKEKIIDIYEKLVQEKNYRCKDILFIVPNNITKLNYIRSLDLKCSEELKITTFSHFVQNEVIKYWPLICEDCSLIKDRKISPSFISPSLSEYILTDYIHEKRNYQNYFEDIVNTDRGICKNILDNISKAVYNDLDIYAVGEKIYESKKNKEKLMKFSYSQMQEVIEFYMETMLSKGILDNSLSIYLYNNYLLKKDLYLKRLREEYSYLIVDSLESSSVCEVNLIELLINEVKDAYIFYDTSKDYSSFKNVDTIYTRNNILHKYFKDKSEIYDKNIGLMDLYNTNTLGELNENAHLYDEMIDNVSEKVIDLINSGEKQEDIVIISPVNNTLLDYKIKVALKENNVEVVNTKIDNKIIDHPYANALVTATCIFYELQNLIKDEEFINFIEIIFGVNRIAALIIYNNRHNHEDYKELIQYIHEKKEKDLRVSEFLIQFYIEKMLNLKKGKESIISCKDIIKQSEVFEEILKDFVEDDKEKGKIFIRCLKENINDYYMSSDLEDIKNMKKIIITTPYTYINANIDRKTQIWLDIGSNAWNMKIERDITNPLVLRKSFNEKEIYSDDMEDAYKKYYLYNLIYNLLITSEKVYAFKSEYSVNGFMQESMLYGLLLKLLDKGEVNNG